MTFVSGMREMIERDAVRELEAARAENPAVTLEAVAKRVRLKYAAYYRRLACVMVDNYLQRFILRRLTRYMQEVRP